MGIIADNDKPKIGRGRVDIDWDFVGQLLEAHCSAGTIAARIGIDRKTLYNRCETDLNISFSTYLQQKKEKGDDDLRNKQHEVAMSGDKVMLVWLGKNRLGQSDKRELQVTESNWDGVIENLAKLILTQGLSTDIESARAAARESFERLEPVVSEAVN